MANPKGMPIMYQQVCNADMEAAHKFYIRFPFLKKDYQILKNVPKNGVALDIGCAEGRYLRRASLIREDLRLIGLDIGNYTQAANSSCMDLFMVSDCNRRLPFKGNSIDFVHCAHVIEHLNKPSDLIKEVHRVLKSGGSAYFEAPDVKSMFIPSLGIRGTLNFYDDPTHIRPYSLESLRRLAIEAGFEEKNIKVFFARNSFNFLFLPYTFFKFLTSGYNVYLENILQPILGLAVGGIFVKD